MTTSDLELAVHTTDLTRTFGSFIAVDHVSLNVRKGEIFGFLGANGAGKTTTIRILCGLLRATSGTARVAGIDLIRYPEKVKQHLGYMSQRFSLYDDLKVKDNLIFFGGVYGLPGSALKQRIADISEAIGLTALWTRPVKGLPTGWKQRLALAASILHDPEVIFLDEPTGGVDPASRNAFWGLIYSLAESGKTIFVTTHYMDEAEYCHRIAVMYRGRILTCDSPGKIRRASGYPTLEEAFIHLISTEINADR